MQYKLVKIKLKVSILYFDDLFVPNIINYEVKIRHFEIILLTKGDFFMTLFLGFPFLQLYYGGNSLKSRQKH